MKISELKEFIKTLPDELDDYTLVNGEYGYIDGETLYRVDKPILIALIDEEAKELCLLHQTREDVINLNGDNLSDLKENDKQ